MGIDFFEEERNSLRYRVENEIETLKRWDENGNLVMVKSFLPAEQVRELERFDQRQGKNRIYFRVVN